MIFDLKIEGVNATMTELKSVRTGAFTTGVLRKIFKTAMKPLLSEAKKNAIRVKTESGTFRGGMDLKKAIGFKTPKKRSIAAVSVGVIQSKLRTTSKTTGKPYEAHGRKGVPIAHWQELGTKDRGHRGRIKPAFPIWRAYKDKRDDVMDIAEELMTQRMIDFTRGRFTHLRFHRR